MLCRLLDALLLVVVVIGGSLAWQSGRERSQLSDQYRRLVKRAGNLVVSDPTKVYIQALDTGEHFHFAWRVYVPAKYTLMVGSSPNGHMMNMASSQSEFIARVRLREGDRGTIEAYTHFGPSSSRSSLGDEAMGAILHGRWDKIRVDQLGAPVLAVLEPNESATVLRLTLPDDLADEARKKLDPRTPARHVPVLFELTLGPRTPTRVDPPPTLQTE